MGDRTRLRRLAPLLLLVWWLTPSLSLARPLVVASKKFPENALLAEALAQLLEQRGLSVERKLNMGNTALVFENLKHGNVDVYPEYSGTAQQFLSASHEIEQRTPAAVRRFVEAELRRRHELFWGPPLGFNNTYAIAVRAKLAQQHQLETISDLAAFSHQGGLRFVFTHEFLARQDGWKPLAKRYDLKAEPRAVEHGIAYELLATSQADAMEVYSTEGLIAVNDVVLLQDDLRHFPPYDAAYVYGSAVGTNADALMAINSLAGRLTDERMRQLNHLVEVEGRSIPLVANQLLSEERLLAKSAMTQPAATGKAGFWRLLETQPDLLLSRIRQHLWLTLLALMASACVGIPLGYGATRKRWLGFVSLSGANIVQTVPSLALLVFMIPVATLLSRLTSGLADAMELAALGSLFLYGVLPIIRNTKDGLQAVDPAITDAATGLGMDRAQIARQVLLPLAAPFIIAGLRTSVVIGTGAATLAAFIGAGGLGEAIISGLAVQNYAEVLTGAVPAALLAIAFDAGFALLQRRFRYP